MSNFFDGEKSDYDIFKLAKDLAYSDNGIIKEIVDNCPKSSEILENSKKGKNKEKRAVTFTQKNNTKTTKFLNYEQVLYYEKLVEELKLNIKRKEYIDELTKFSNKENINYSQINDYLLLVENIFEEEIFDEKGIDALNKFFDFDKISNLENENLKNNIVSSLLFFKEKEGDKIKISEEQVKQLAEKTNSLTRLFGFNDFEIEDIAKKDYVKQIINLGNKKELDYYKIKEFLFLIEDIYDEKILDEYSIESLNKIFNSTKIKKIENNELKYDIVSSFLFFKEKEGNKIKNSDFVINGLIKDLEEVTKPYGFKKREISEIKRNLNINDGISFSHMKNKNRKKFIINFIDLNKKVNLHNFISLIGLSAYIETNQKDKKSSEEGKENFVKYLHKFENKLKKFENVYFKNDYDVNDLRLVNGVDPKILQRKKIDFLNDYKINFDNKKINSNQDKIIELSLLLGNIEKKDDEEIKQLILKFDFILDKMFLNITQFKKGNRISVIEEKLKILEFIKKIDNKLKEKGFFYKLKKIDEIDDFILLFKEKEAVARRVKKEESIEKEKALNLKINNSKNSRKEIDFKEKFEINLKNNDEDENEFESEDKLIKNYERIKGNNLKVEYLEGLIFDLNVGELQKEEYESIIFTLDFILREMLKNENQFLKSENINNLKEKIYILNLVKDIDKKLAKNGYFYNIFKIEKVDFLINSLSVKFNEAYNSKEIEEYSDGDLNTFFSNLKEKEKKNIEDGKEDNLTKSSEKSIDEILKGGKTTFVEKNKILNYSIKENVEISEEILIKLNKFFSSMNVRLVSTNTDIGEKDKVIFLNNILKLKEKLGKRMNITETQIEIFIIKSNISDILGIEDQSIKTYEQKNKLLKYYQVFTVKQILEDYKLKIDIIIVNSLLNKKYFLNGINIGEKINFIDLLLKIEIKLNSEEKTLDYRKSSGNNTFKKYLSGLKKDLQNLNDEKIK